MYRTRTEKQAYFTALLANTFRTVIRLSQWCCTAPFPLDPYDRGTPYFRAKQIVVRRRLLSLVLFSGIIAAPFLLYFHFTKQINVYNIPLSIKLMYYIQTAIQICTIGYVLLVYQFRTSYHHFYFDRLVYVLEEFGRADIVLRTNGGEYGQLVIVIVLAVFIYLNTEMLQLYQDVKAAAFSFDVIGTKLINTAQKVAMLFMFAYSNRLIQLQTNRFLTQTSLFLEKGHEIYGMTSIDMTLILILALPFLLYHQYNAQINDTKIPLTIKLMYYMQAVLQMASLGYVLLVYQFRTSFHRFYFDRLVLVLVEFGRPDIGTHFRTLQRNVRRLLVFILMEVVFVVTTILGRERSWANLLKSLIFATTQIIATSLTLQYLTLFGTVWVLLRQMNDTLERFLPKPIHDDVKDAFQLKSARITPDEEQTIEKIRLLQLKLQQIVLRTNGGEYGQLLIVMLLTIFVFLNTELHQLYQGIKTDAFTPDRIAMMLINSGLKFAMLLIFAFSNRMVQKQTTRFISQTSLFLEHAHKAYGMISIDMTLILSVIRISTAPKAKYQSPLLGFLAFPSYVLQQDVERRNFRTRVLQYLNTATAVIIAGTSTMSYVVLYMYYPEVVYKENSAVFQIMYHMENWLKASMVLIAMLGPRIGPNHLRKTIDQIVQVMQCFDRAGRIDVALGAVVIVSKRLMLLYSVHSVAVAIAIGLNTEHPISTLLNVIYIVPYITLTINILLYHALLSSIGGIVRCLNENLLELTLQDRNDERPYDKHTITISYIKLNNAKEIKTHQSSVVVEQIAKLSTLHATMMDQTRRANRHFGVLMLIILLSTFIQINMTLLELYSNIGHTEQPEYCLWIFFLHAVVHFTFFLVIARLNHAIQQENERTLLLLHEFRCSWNNEQSMTAVGAITSIMVVLIQFADSGL
uniref:Gustatory receptor n=1 Tax=Anopheles farauti TaxID=69004 RepID=A0A182Q1W6_9DIPT